MIVNKSQKGFHIIYHSSHALLAGKIAYHIDEKHRTPHWYETLIAVTEHDDRQLNFSEKDYLSELGIPLDFTEEKTSVNKVLKRLKSLVKQTKNKSYWITLLISYHMEFLYIGKCSTSKLMKKFLTDQEKIREDILKFYNIPDEKGRQYYELLRFCDRLSLILCKDETPETGRFLEINKSINNISYTIRKTDQGKLTIEPWIFKIDNFVLTIEETIIAKAKFSSSKQFGIDINKTPRTLKEWHMSKQ